MADTEEFVDGENLPECPAQVGSAAAFRGEQGEPFKTESTTSFPPGEEWDSPLHMEGEPSLLSMPCLMKELRRDSPESQHASTSSDKPASGHVYESDSSNPCMLSPSSSGHQADSDTLSSGEEGAASRASGDEGTTVADTGLAAGCQTSSSSRQKSRRSRSESEMSTNTMAAKKNRCQPAVAGGAGGEKQTNGRLAKVKGHRSQKHKERIRLLRQKREAAARKKYNLLQDSSTSDSDLTCDSSTSSSEDETSGGKTITTDIPAGFCRAAEGSGVSAQIQGLLDSGGSWDRNSIGSVLEEAMTRFAVMQQQTEEHFRVWMEKLTRLDSHDSGDSSIHSSDAPVLHRHRAPRLSLPSSFLPSSESQETMAAYMLAQENITMSSMSPDPLNNNVLPDVVPVATQNGNPDISDPGLLKV
ncbi:uncharacterized protein C18orf25 homolog isoform X2 [Oncorhynchus tshawytscha]|uniref:uncharacterized protein C18orf25 homolog isoform X2 n=1 Tax=Oncorhynchus tshawytscha TaxID=74940 RepID=UPI001637F140|nr:uncharacterized protein C18orf25 homolog isoform X2 [Oncorhynchus tshawytscha]